MQMLSRLDGAIMTVMGSSARGAFVNLDDNEDNDAPKGERNKEKTNRGRWKRISKDESQDRKLERVN